MSIACWQQQLICLKNIKNIIVDFRKDIECQFSISNDLPGEEHWVQILFWWKCVSEARGHLSVQNEGKLIKLVLCVMALIKWKNI